MRRIILAYAWLSIVLTDRFLGPSLSIDRGLSDRRDFLRSRRAVVRTRTVPKNELPVENSEYWLDGRHRQRRAVSEGRKGTRRGAAGALSPATTSKQSGGWGQKSQRGAKKIFAL